MSADAAWPRVGCDAAILKGDQLLLVCRRWGPPGGKVDAFETVVDATAREIREELGILITPGELLCVVDQIDRAEGHHWVAPIFRISHFEGAPAIMEPDALSDWGWFEVDALPDALTQATKQAVQRCGRRTRGAGLLRAADSPLV
ncbi:hypothetical protein LA66_17480 [Aureimonas altamirensis]|uniref:Nudix hydrolase domain-containing protein n=1 Tax=Aureimonas altamirensis TaxID=370622 RepID=A0A0B1Q041_9HYPH|nr:NUDIX domain-containing protein [Aureimonas altamirensis]KHJ53709.1 hypothetical protein LA66_17480 [Aureimonas altamirensis]